MAIKIFVDGNSTLTVADNNVSVIGAAAGSETIKILAGVTGTAVDANIEKIDLAGNLADYKLGFVAGTGTQLLNAAGVVVATIPSLNQASKVAFLDGSAPLVQTATGFTLGSAAVPTTAAAITAATLGTTFDTTVKSSVVATTTTTPVVATLPTLSVAAATLAEGNTGTANMVFTVTLSAASTSAVTVAYATTAGTAVAGSDFTSTSGTLTIAANALTGTISVPVLGDAVFEASETLTLTLSNPTNATVSTTAGVVTGTITNDDTNASPVLVVPTTAASAFIGSTTAVTGISFTDADDNAGFTVTLQASGNSQVSLAAVTNVSAKNTAGTAILVGETSNLITLSGTKADLNTALAGSNLRYSTNSTIPTTESITLTVTDPNGAKTTGSVSVNIGQSLILTTGSTDNLVGSAGDDLFTGAWNTDLHTTDTIAASTGTDKLTLTSVGGAVTGVISGIEVLDLTLANPSTLTVTSGNFGTALNTINLAGTPTFGTTANSGTTFNLSPVTNGALTVTNLLVPSTSANSAVTTDAITLNFNGTSGAASVLTSLTDTASTIDTLNIVSTGTNATANSITTLNGLATNATVNVSGAQAFTATLPSLGTTGAFNGAAATGKLTITTNAAATTVSGGTAGDVLTGAGGADSISGNAGNDTIDGGAANDVITGGLGTDSITGGTGVNTFVFAAGDSPSTGRDTIVDLKETDIIKFGTALTGLTNGATLTTSSANAIYVDTTNNRLVVGSDQINIPSAVANAAFTYSSGTDATAGTADDTITVGAAPFSAINGGIGALTLTGKSISTVTVDMSSTPPKVNGSTTLNGTNVTAVNKLDASKVTTGAVNAVGSTGADSIVGSDQNDVIYGGGSEVQTITIATNAGGGGTQTVFGLSTTIASGDTAAASATKIYTTLLTALNGGAGSAAVTNANVASITDDGAGVLTITYKTSAGDVAAATVTNAGVTSQTQTTLTTIVGLGDGNDTISGGLGADTISGGVGADLMTGGAGIDAYAYGIGLAGQSIVASASSIGAAGNAFAAGNTLTFATTSAGNVDRITDFVSGVDTLDVVNAGSVGTALTAGVNNLDLTSGTTYYAYGIYATSTGVFTVVAASWNATTAPDALVVVGDAGSLTPVTTTGYVVLTGLNQTLVTADFV